MGSVIARGCIHSGLPPKRILEIIFESSRSYFSFLMPTSFHRLGFLTGKSPEQILDEHTVFPYSVAFMPNDERERLRNKALRLNVQADCLGSLTKSVTHGVPFRRVCPQCIADDLKTYGEAYWHRSHLLPAVHICAKHGTRLHETHQPLRRNSKGNDISFPTLFGHRPVTNIAPCFILESVTEASMAAFSPTTLLESDWHEVYRTMSIQKGYRLEGGAIASKALSADVSSFYGGKFLEDCGAQFREGAAGSWPSLMPRDGLGAAFAPVKHVLMQTFLNAQTNQTLNVTVCYSRPGKVADDCIALDAKTAKELQNELHKAERSGGRLTVQGLLRSIGVWEKFRHHRDKFPKTNALVQAFRASAQSERQLGRRKRIYKKVSTEG